MSSDIRVDPADWPDRVQPADRPQLVVGGPGTGKTEFLVRRATRLIEQGHAGNLLVLSFSRRGAVDLDARIRSSAPDHASAIDVTTYHSFAARLVEAHATYHGWDRAPDVLPGPDQKRLVAELLEMEDPGDWSHAYRPLLTTRTFADEVTDFILRCREQLIGPSELTHRERDRADWRGLSSFLDRYDRTLRSRSVIDYGTLLAEAAALLLDPQIADDLAARHRYVLVDEYQDTTRGQSILLQRLVAGHGRLTAAADPYQSIYSFRGADIQNVARFPEDFSIEGVEAERLVLTTSFRVPADILDAAVRITAHELPGAAGKVIPAPGTGSVEAYRFTRQVEEAEWIASEIHRLNLEQRIPLERIAVFTRSKSRFLTPLSRSLEVRGVPHEPPDERLIDQPAVRFIFDLAFAAGRSGNADAVDHAMRRILLGPMFSISPALMAELLALRATRETAWSDLVRNGIDDGTALADLLADPSWATASPAVDGLWRIWSELPQIGELVTSPRRIPDRAAWTSFAQVLARWNDRNPEGTLLEYRDHSDSEEFEASPLLPYHDGDTDRVTVTTLHQAKGLAFDVVFIADAVEGIFPDLRSRDSLLGTRHLQPHLPTDAAGYLSFRLQEERRLAYTAMTRASRRVVWTATDSGSDLDGGTPSRFLPLATGTASVDESAGDPDTDHRPITMGQAEAMLRRVAADPVALPPRRLAAIDTLARGPAIGLRPARELTGVAERGSDTGVVERPVVLSPSQADAYERCPRAYVLQQKMRIGSDPNRYTEFGTLIHSVLEHVETAAQERGDRHGTADEALAHLDSLLTPGMFGENAVDAAWRERARAALQNLYALWPSTGAPVRLEIDLGLERGDVRWRGRADRIERRDGSIVVVDYKTGRTVTGDESAASIQLGFYLIAARETPELASLGPVAGAEMWFPLHPLKHTIATRPFDLGNLPDIERRMAAAAHGIADEDWNPKPGPACERCAVRTLCPAMPEGKEAFTS